MPQLHHDAGPLAREALLRLFADELRVQAGDVRLEREHCAALDQKRRRCCDMRGLDRAPRIEDRLSEHGVGKDLFRGGLSF